MGDDSYVRSNWWLNG